jgi:hypothetical protein
VSEHVRITFRNGQELDVTCGTVRIEDGEIRLLTGGFTRRIPLSAVQAIQVGEHPGNPH